MSRAAHRASPAEQLRRRRARWLDTRLRTALGIGVLVGVVGGVELSSTTRDLGLARELSASGSSATAHDARFLVEPGGRGGAMLDRAEAVVEIPGEATGIVARLRSVDVDTTGLGRGWHDAPPGSAYDGTFDVVVAPGERPVAMEVGDLEQALRGNAVDEARTVLVVGVSWTVWWVLVAWGVVRARSRARPPGSGSRIRRRVMSR
ncbi:hypothetical protein [Oerskovia sp. KBS0722]|uniref:hypothetical protein n=1 Tax=Oerskovia sp. KBS0722 TaxID=1179673 RepID=UPI00110F4D17|nr:hypothetical protein [Oerskovia sp. KBS0722]QDW61537.1 hypothetical protein FFI11_002490 [Oerskovia sp. KBS0722]